MSQSVQGMTVKNVCDNTKYDSALKKSQSLSNGFKRAAVQGFKSVLSAAQKTADGVKQTLSAAFNTSKYIAGGAIAGGAALGALVKQGMDAGDKMDKMSKRTGLSAEMLSKLSFAAGQSGTDIDVLEKGVMRLAKNANDAANGLSTPVRAFDALGISFKSSTGELKSTEQLLLESVDALSAMANETERAAVAQDLFGRAGKELIPLLKEGPTGFNALMTEASELGTVWNNQTAKAAADLTDSVGRLRQIVSGLSQDFNNEVIPVVTQVTEGFVAWYKANRELVSNNVKEWAVSVGGGIKSMLETLAGWAKDGTLTLWWERIRLAVMGVEVAIAGVVSASKYALALVYKTLQAKNELQYLADNSDKTLGRAVEYRNLADRYSTEAGQGSRAAVNAYSTQAQKVADLQAAVDIRRNTAAKQAAQGGTVVNVNVNNSLLGKIDNKQAEAMGAALKKEIDRGRLQLQAG